MRYKSRQRGMSIFAMMIMAVLLAFVGLFGLRLFPIYMESFKIDAAMEGVINDPNLLGMSKRDIAFSLTKRLDLDDVKRITEKNYKDYLTVKKEGENVDLTVSYRAEQPLFMNLSLVASFTKQVQN